MSGAWWAMAYALSAAVLAAVAEYNRRAGYKGWAWFCLFLCGAYVYYFLRSIGVLP